MGMETQTVAAVWNRTAVQRGGGGLFHVLQMLNDSDYNVNILSMKL